MRQVLNDINDLLVEEPKRAEVNFEEVKRAKERRELKDIYRQTIYNFLRKNNKEIGLLTKEDIIIMTEGMDTIKKTLFMDQVKYCLEVNRGKPIKWIVENHKSLLFNEF